MPRVDQGGGQSLEIIGSGRHYFSPSGGASAAEWAARQDLAGRRSPAVGAALGCERDVRFQRAAGVPRVSLTTMTAAPRPVAIGLMLIGTYQRYVSPRKGFRCAYRARHRQDSCSQFARRAIDRFGVWSGIHLLRRRLDKCHHAKRALDYLTPRRDEEKQAHSFPWSAGDCVSGCEPGVPVDVCHRIAALSNVTGSTVQGAGDAAAGLAGAATCDTGCCGLSI